MFKGKCLNPQILKIMGETGHTDTLCICDAGFPVPIDVERVDLAWERGKPGWLEVCSHFGEMMVIEGIILAEEIKTKNPKMLEEFREVFPDKTIVFIPHVDFKKRTSDCRAIVRTGEFSPFCNCILVAGVNF